MQLLQGFVILTLLSSFVYAEDVVEENNPNNDETTSEQQQPSGAEYRDASSSSSSASYPHVTGFYAGGDLGLSKLSNKISRKFKAQDDADEQIHKNKRKSGFSGDIFGGYNFQIGNLILGAECMVGMDSAKPVTVITDKKTEILKDKTTVSSTTDSVLLKREYTFGLVPRFGYAIFNGLNAYLNLGTTFSKYKLQHKEKTEEQHLKSKSKNKSKPSLLLGLGVEQNFGILFVRAECNKIFKRKISEIGAIKVGSDAYIMKIGAGCRF